MSTHREFVEIGVNADYVEGVLELPDNPIGIVAFAQDGDGRRLSRRDHFVAEHLRQAHLGTLLLNLLTKAEHQNKAVHFNITLLTQRLNAVCHWLDRYSFTTKLPLGLLGSGSGLAAVLHVAATHSKGIAAIVGRAGRPDLANVRALKAVKSPTLFIVGGNDYDVLMQNRRMYFLMNCRKKFEIIPSATHFFEERGALEKVAELAAAWFAKHMTIPVFQHHLKKP